MHKRWYHLGMGWIKRQLDKPSPIEWMGVVAVVVAGLAAVWAWLADFFTSEFAWTFIPITVALISVVLFGANQILQIKERLKKPSPTGISEDDLEPTISGWLLRTGYKISKIESSEALFTFNVTDDYRQNISVTRFKDDPDRLTIFEGYVLSADQINALASLPTDVASEIFEDLRIDLASFDIELITEPTEKDEREGQAMRFFLQDKVAFEFHFNEDNFFERLSYVRRATTVVSEYLRRALRISAALPQESCKEGSPSEEAERECPETGKDCRGC